LQGITTIEGTYAMEIFLEAPPELSGSEPAAASSTTACAFRKEAKHTQRRSSSIVIGERILAMD
jgi:hypothetical protein